MRWSDIKKEKEGDYALNYKKKQILVSKEIRKIIGKRKSEERYIFNLPTNKSTTSKIFNKMLKESGLNKKIRMADAIHTFAYNLYKKTKNIYLISSYLDHKSIEITKSKYNYMKEDKYLIENNLQRDNILTKNKFKGGKLFKKGRLLSYKQDTP